MLNITTFRRVPEDIQRDITLLYKIASFKNKNYAKLSEPVLGTTVVYEDDILVGVSTILMRDCYNLPRIMNRYYYDDGSKGLRPKYFTGKIRKTFVDMFDQQTDLVYSLGYTGCFTSREKSTGFDRLVDGLNEYSKYKWKWDSKHLVNYQDLPNNWQYIIYTGDKYEYTRSI